MPGSVVSELAERRRSRLIKVLLHRWFFHFNAWERPASPSEIRTRRGHGRPSPICPRSRGRCIETGLASPLSLSALRNLLLLFLPDKNRQNTFKGSYSNDEDDDAEQSRCQMCDVTSDFWLQKKSGQVGKLWPREPQVVDELLILAL